MDVQYRRFTIALIAIALAALLAGCGQQGTAPADADAADAEPSVEASPAASEVVAAAPEPVAVQQKQPPQVSPKPKTTQPVAPRPPAVEQPTFVSVSVPPGTEIEIELLDTLSSGTNQVGDVVRGRLSRDLRAEGRLVAPAGADVRGTVTEVVPLKKFGGQPSISFAFESLAVEDGSSARLVAQFTQLGKKQAGRDAAKIGGAAAAGAILGHQVDGDKGKAVGAAVGGAIGTAVAAKTGKEVEMVAGTFIVVPLENEIRVRLKS